jgi:thiol-disulfide isomerase/thioredoxin
MSYLMRGVLLLFFGILCSGAQAQTVSGQLLLLADQDVKLMAFDGFNTPLIAQGKIDAEGRFSLGYAPNDYGVGYLTSADDKPFIVILSGEDVELVGEALSMPETIRITKGQQNQWFEQYAKEHPHREQALSAWTYLERIYSGDSLFIIQDVPKAAIRKEMARITDEDVRFLTILPEGSYIKWFLPTRKLVSSVSTVAQYRPEEIDETLAAFRALNHADPRLYRSGLLRDAIEGHYWLIENSGQPLDTITAMMQESIDVLVDQLLGYDDRLNEITNYLFDLLERHSLYGASEHLALRLLNETGCTLETDLARQLETYRAMRVGNTAADIVFNGELRMKGVEHAALPKKLTDFQADYTLVVFAASWCPTCNEELPQLINHYPKWKNAGVEVVLVSLDDDKTAFDTFASSTPFLSFCDLRKWQGQAVNDYYVFGTPTFFLLDAQRKIVLRPNSVKHADAWVEWNLLRK